MSPAPPRTIHPAKRALRAARVSMHLVAGLATTTLVFPFVAPRSRDALKRRWSRRLLHLLGVQARVHGQLDAHQGNVLVVCNHVSWLDIFVLNAHRPARFVAKAELARWPVAGRMIRGAGTIFVERERRRDARRVNHHAAHALASGEVVVVFPEGTTTDGTSVAKFHGALLQPIVEAGGHVLPVGLRYRDPDGSPSTVPVYGDETFAQSFWRVCGARGIVVELHALPPLHARGRHRRELARQAESAIRTALALPAPATEPGTRDDR